MTYATLISAADLAAHLDDANWLVIDCRHDLANPDAGAQAYAAGHIPQARFAHLDKILSGTKNGADGKFKGRHPLPERQAFIDAMQELGVGKGTQVIAYDAHGGMFAARLWWLLRWVGHVQVAVLDGGLPAWQAQGGQLSTETPAPVRGDLQEQAPLVTTVDVGDVVANLDSKALTVIDARAADRYRGENETMDAVGGHIPGAKNRFFKDNLGADGRFKSADALRAEWNALIDSPQAAVMQCGSGVTACHNLLALEVAGLPGARLYPGSWSEWSSDSSRPVATGAQP
ncbi:MULTISPECIES: sulfurtransferase [unclassified Herbaspirillum]|uniref:sulfurtransferase n=1 Tax=unclassified Herbaspirillum TaxID=2624150 RepID=UPI000E2F6709|nr:MULTISPECIES: sulfurtransferase [unclassified Herbaspirillum]RFB69433.1 sulfurtransferase [Herbaspirillum sp. 3R-3a1]TFI07513.1 sulfurtransferase [Herbaspirillum sp. 3R11]TFI12287.1 sulfurtransferase [Herbaspirillum sp. 3R-11]TFI29373.1 sulfurtransferase [Herbaspirillum sp. 3C11]